MKSLTKILIYSVTICLTTSGCTNNSNKTESEELNPTSLSHNSDSTTIIVDSSDIVPNAKSILFSDTISVGNYLLIINQTDTVSKLVDYPNPTLWYYKKANLDKVKNITRAPDSLNFQLFNGKKLSLINEPYLEDESNYAENVSYHYVNSIGDYWQVDALCYEYNFTVLVNQYTGDTINTIAPGPISPSKRFIICSNVDLETQYTENGIELFELKNNHHSKIGFTEITNWGLFQIEWITDNKLKAIKVDMTENYSYILTNVTINLIKNEYNTH